MNEAWIAGAIVGCGIWLGVIALTLKDILAELRKRGPQ